MESLIAAVLGTVVLAVLLGLLALPFVLVRAFVRAPRRPAPPPTAYRPPPWTDDDEIEARHHL